MNFAEKVFNLRGEIIKDINELIVKYGIVSDKGERCLDCWGYKPVKSLKTIYFVISSPILGLRFDMGEDGLSYQSEFSIDELANLADILHLYYKD